MKDQKQWKMNKTCENNSMNYVTGTDDMTKFFSQRIAYQTILKYHFLPTTYLEKLKL